MLPGFREEMCGIAIPEKGRVNRLIGVRCEGLRHEVIEDRSDRFPIRFNYGPDEGIHATSLPVERENGTANLAHGPSTYRTSTRLPVLIDTATREFRSNTSSFGSAAMNIRAVPTTLRTGHPMLLDTTDGFRTKVQFCLSCAYLRYGGEPHGHLPRGRPSPHAVSVGLSQPTRESDSNLLCSTSLEQAYCAC